MNLAERVDDIERRLKACEEGVRKVKETVDKVQGQPIIRAAYGARLDLNNTLDVDNLLTEVARLKSRIERGGL